MQHLHTEFSHVKFRTRDSWVQGAYSYATGVVTYFLSYRFIVTSFPGTYIDYEKEGEVTTNLSSVCLNNV